MMNRYRRRPVEIEAVQYVVRTTPADDAKPIVEFINSNGGKALFIYDWVDDSHHEPRIRIETREGTFSARVGDYVCRDAVGFWPVRADVFERTNELVSPAEVEI